MRLSRWRPRSDFNELRTFIGNIPAVSGCLSETLPACQRRRRYAEATRAPVCAAGRLPGWGSPAENPVRISTALFQARSTWPNGRGMPWRHTASFLTSFGMARRDECHVAGPKAASCPAPVGNKDLARDDVHRFIDRITPPEASGGARPRHHRGGAVGALGEPPRARLRLSLDDPTRADRIVRKRDVGGAAKTIGSDMASPRRIVRQVL